MSKICVELSPEWLVREIPREHLAPANMLEAFEHYTNP